MPMLRINAAGQLIGLHGAAQPASSTLRTAAHYSGPVVIMIHGYKYSPFVAQRCPHTDLLGAKGWPNALDLEPRGALGIAFGWHARGRLRQVHDDALATAQTLARLIAALRRTGRPVHLIAHSLGATLALAALPYLLAGDVGRVVLLSAAAHRDLATHALASPAGLRAEMIHVTSRENTLFDFAFERLIPGCGALGRGFEAVQATNVQIDCAATLSTLSRLGYHLDPPARRICHWSSYTRPGVMALNAALLFGDLPLHRLRQARPASTSHPSRLRAVFPLAPAPKTGIIQGRMNNCEGPPHEHAY